MRFKTARATNYIDYDRNVGQGYFDDDLEVANGLAVSAGSTDLACNGTDAVDFNATYGAVCTLKCKTANIAITETDTTHEVADWIPAGIMVVGCVGLVTTTITGATGTISVGPDGAATAWCNAKATMLLAGTSFDSFVDGAATGPTIVPALDVLRITSGTGNFTAGAIRITIWYFDLTAPTS